MYILYLLYVFVYHCIPVISGMFNNIYIGTVNYVDKDDHDRDDKTFTLNSAGSSTAYFE